MKTILFASGNKGKQKEIQDIIKDFNLEIKVLSLKDMPNKIDEPIENGKTFSENAYIKAKYYYDNYKIPCIADDSGLCIDYLKGYPGIYTARFLGDVSQEIKNQGIIDILKDETSRNAHFTSAICFYDGKDAKYYEGIMPGKIDSQIRGTNGFGYDPIFICDEYNINVGLLDSDKKNKISHRYKAMKKWVESLEKE